MTEKLMVANLENLRQRFKPVNPEVAGKLQGIIDDYRHELPEQLPECLDGPRPDVYYHPLFNYNLGDKTIVMKDGRMVKLTSAEIAVFELLLKTPNQIVFLHDFTSTGLRMSVDLLRVYIFRLRTKIEPEAAESKIIINFPKRGYYLVDSSKQPSADPDSPGNSQKEVHPGIMPPTDKSDRSPDQTVRDYHHRFFTYDYQGKCAVVGGQRVNLTPKEVSLLEFLLDHPNEAFPTPVILESAFGQDYSSGMVKTYIAYLRHKIEPDPASPQIFITKGHQGYYLADYDRVSQEVSVSMEPNIEEVFEHSDGWSSNISRGLLTVNGQSVDLTSTERRLLEKLVRNTNKVVTKEALIRSAWGDDADANDVNLSQYVYRLLSKIQPDREKGEPGCIKVIRRLGYCLVDPSRL